MGALTFRKAEEEASSCKPVKVVYSSQAHIDTTPDDNGNAHVKCDG